MSRTLLLAAVVLYPAGFVAVLGDHPWLGTLILAAALTANILGKTE